MPKPQLRSRSLRRVHRKSATSVNIVYRRKKPQPHHCASCGMVMQGTPNVERTRASQRRPERPYGGYLCGTCTKRKISEEALTWT